MTAHYSLIPGRTGAHRAPLQEEPTGIARFPFPHPGPKLWNSCSSLCSRIVSFSIDVTNNTCEPISWNSRTRTSRIRSDASGTGNPNNADGSVFSGSADQSSLRSHRGVAGPVCLVPEQFRGSHLAGGSAPSQRSGPLRFSGQQSGLDRRKVSGLPGEHRGKAS